MHYIWNWNTAEIIVMNASAELYLEEIVSDYLGYYRAAPALSG